MVLNRRARRRRSDIHVTRTSESGLRALALFEAAKGALVLLTGIGLLSLVHHNVEGIAVEVLKHFHLNPARHYPRILIEAASSVTDARLWTLALCACLYAVVRLIEGYGLWHSRRWAEWFGVASGGIYLPIELYELTRGVSTVKLAFVGVNAGIVVYLARTLSSPSAQTGFDRN